VICDLFRRGEVTIVISSDSSLPPAMVAPSTWLVSSSPPLLLLQIRPLSLNRSIFLLNTSVALLCLSVPSLSGFSLHSFLLFIPHLTPKHSFLFFISRFPLQLTSSAYLASSILSGLIFVVSHVCPFSSPNKSLFESFYHTISYIIQVS
jgi:hypothetical protein